MSPEFRYLPQLILVGKEGTSPVRRKSWSWKAKGPRKVLEKERGKEGWSCVHRHCWLCVEQALLSFGSGCDQMGPARAQGCVASRLWRDVSAGAEDIRRKPVSLPCEQEGVAVALGLREVGTSRGAADARCLPAVSARAI